MVCVEGVRRILLEVQGRVFSRDKGEARESIDFKGTKEGSHTGACGCKADSHWDVQPVKGT